MAEPRLMSGASAAEYCELTPATFSQWVSSGRLPPPLPGTRRWDRKAIDIALDKASGIVAPSIVPHEDEFSKWKSGRETRKGTAGVGDRK